MDLLRKPAALHSPFFEDHLEWRLEFGAFFRRLAADKARPVLRDEDRREYIPTQLLADMVRSSGYDGIVYPSAMGPGHNIVLFDLDAGAPEPPRNLRVKRFAMTCEEIQASHVEIDDWPYDA
ncbi:MAG: RES family NAD+ phosphorylase [Acidobacteria bacterium]|nr:RES family NAD+ phosphorylase [Acidobacteriota bacterium]